MYPCIIAGELKLVMKEAAQEKRVLRGGGQGQNPVDHELVFKGQSDKEKKIKKE